MAQKTESSRPNALSLIPSARAPAEKAGSKTLTFKALMHVP